MAGLQARVRGLILPLLAALLLVLAALAMWQEHASAARADASRESVAAATAAARAIFSYDHKGFDAAVANGVSFTTGDFTREYEQTTGALREAVMSEQAVVRAEVSAAGVISASADRAEILLYVNQFRKNINIQGEKMDQNRVVLTMARTHAGWKVVGATAI
jgi:Mce-associated membrane protein